MKALLLLLVACAGSSSTPVANRGGSGSSVQAVKAVPDLAAVRAAVAPHAGHLFDDAAIARGCPGDQSLGDYVATLVKYGTGEPGSPDTHRLTGGCGPFPAELAPIDPPRDPAYWYCRIDSFTVDPAGESPWHYELRLRIHQTDRSVDLATFGCPGTP